MEMTFEKIDYKCSKNMSTSNSTERISDRNISDMQKNIPKESVSAQH
jgi:hypothetical protein